MESKITKEMLEAFKAMHDNILALTLEHVRENVSYYGACYWDGIKHVWGDRIELFDTDDPDDTLTVRFAELIDPSIIEDELRKRKAEKEKRIEANIKRQIAEAKELLKQHGEL